MHGKVAPYSDIKANKCKTIVTFDTVLESKILDAGNILILSNLLKPWTIVCKDVDRTFELEYSTYRILNRSKLCECSLTAGNYLLSQAASNCGGTLQVKDGFFTTYYAFNWILLDMLTEKFNLQVDEDTVTQSMLLHSDIPGYDLPAIDFVSPLEEAQESHIVEEQDAKICTHLEMVLVHMIENRMPKFSNLVIIMFTTKNISPVFKICRNMAICISYLFVHSFSL